MDTRGTTNALPAVWVGTRHLMEREWGDEGASGTKHNSGTCYFTASAVSTTLSAALCIGIVGVYIWTSIQFYDNLEGKAKKASKKLETLNRVQQYFKPDPHLLGPY
ncbi:hypothetical protein EVAR_82198_1 [Eumeta japonica]|uniref:Uncharacterized protein n=1 Tax=Eumeta variegata TaxID=151549 RepID=A0A4C1W5L9_EUMVA|nr:hypothetical protein EVAR_82198_1 [Eumeta japonica]